MREGIDSGRRSDHGQSDPRARKQRTHRRIESRHRQRLVCGAALGHGNIYKIYAESFKDETHLNSILSEAQESSTVR